MKEFTATDSLAAKLEISANLANFAYNPVNHDHLDKLNVVNLFLDLTSDANAILCR